jgi:DNA-binding IclR family transcriptional regulator
MHGEASVNELVAPFDLRQPTISKHLKVLAEAGLVERRRDAQFRPVRLNAARLEQAWAWLGDYRRFWEESFDRLEEYAKELHAAERAQRSSGGLSGVGAPVRPRKRPRKDTTHGRKKRKDG